jgi:hypothetical protein
VCAVFVFDLKVFAVLSFLYFRGVSLRLKTRYLGKILKLKRYRFNLIFSLFKRGRRYYEYHMNPGIRIKIKGKLKIKY